MATRDVPSGSVRVAIVIPVYNEARWVASSVRRVLGTPAPPDASGEPCERTIVLVDDGSTDGTTEIVKGLGDEPGVAALHHGVNCGKGAAVRTGLAHALERGFDAAIIHDADLEYDPADHAAVLAPIVRGLADAVIGSRFIGQTHRVLYYWHFLANSFITTCCNMATNLNLTDVECCSKAFTADALRAMTLVEDRFGIEIELVAKVARARVPARDAAPESPDAPPATPAPLRRARVYEVAVSYAGRTYEDGKKITWRDGVAALACIVRHGVLRT